MVGSIVPFRAAHNLAGVQGIIECVYATHGDTGSISVPPGLCSSLPAKG